MSDYLIHYGVLGQKWGVRNYQNEDGSLTAKGKNRYSTLIRKSNSDYQKQLSLNSKAKRQEIKAAKKELRSGSISKNEYSKLKETAKENRRKADEKAYNDTYKYQTKVLREASGKNIAIDTAINAGKGLAVAAGGTLLRNMGESESNYGMQFIGSYMQGAGAGYAVGSILAGGINYALKDNK